MSFLYYTVVTTMLDYSSARRVIQHKHGIAKMTNEQESDHVELFSRHCLYFIDDYGNHYYMQLNYIQI